MCVLSGKLHLLQYMDLRWTELKSDWPMVHQHCKQVGGSNELQVFSYTDVVKLKILRLRWWWWMINQICQS